MATTYTHDLAIKTGEYQDATGQTKGRWLHIGKVFKHDDGGTTIKLDAMPVGLPAWEGWVSVFKRRERDGKGQAYQGQGAGPQTPPGGGYGGSQHEDDDIPF